MSAIEWAPFTIKQDVTEQELLTRADNVQQMFLSKQDGFIRRVLVRKNTSEYADIVYWNNKFAAEAIGESVMECDVCLAYFELMDQTIESGAGFSHYDIVKEWPNIES